MAAVLPVGRRRWTVGLFAVTTVWIGLLLGVSFLATPAKFMAPSLSLPVALDVGRHTFAIFSRVEWVLTILLAATVLLGARSRWFILAAAAICGLVIAETVGLLPILDRRVGQIIAGEALHPSRLHDLYIWLEVIKLALLAVLAIGTARRLLRLAPDRSAA
jgi:hypothetical protein